jgi:hypothetical protein
MRNKGKKIEKSEGLDFLFYFEGSVVGEFWREWDGNIIKKLFKTDLIFVQMS